MNTDRRKICRRERGQTTLIVVLALSIFLLGFIALAVDFTNLWFHRQTAQTAADSACQAAAMDMYVKAQGFTVGSPGFTPGTDFNCSSTAAAAPCQYASLNGYGAPGLSAGESNEVAVDFPATLTDPSGANIPPVASSLLPPGFPPFVRVKVTDRVPVFFSAVLTGRKTQDVGAVAACGFDYATSPIPIIVLHPSMANAFNIQGTPTVSVKGGAQRSVQVNSTSTSAINVGGNAQIDLSQGGTAGTGSDFGVFGLNPEPTVTKNFNPGSTGNWLSPASPIPDPFAALAVPNPIPPAPSGINPIAVTSPTDGCPDSTGCWRYQAGSYPDGICIGDSCKTPASWAGPPGSRTKDHTTAIFDPGVYYLGGDLNLASNSIVRPSTAAGDSSGGTMFFFSGTATVSVASNSGKAAVTNFDTSLIKCPGGPAPTTLGSWLGNGNVLLGPCSGPYGDPLGQYRGMLMFNNRTTAVSPNWGGGGTLVLAGNLYYHQCKADGLGLPQCSDPGSGGYGTTMQLGGGAGSSTYVLGEIVTDHLVLGGTSAINMTLNPLAAYHILKVQLIQ